MGVKRTGGERQVGRGIEGKGGAGDGGDTIYAGCQTANLPDNNNQVFGGAGYDHITVGNGNNWVQAGNGGSYIQAGYGNDWLYGGAGNDTIIGGAGGYTDGTGKKGTEKGTEKGTSLIMATGEPQMSDVPFSEPFSEPTHRMVNRPRQEIS